MVFCNTIDALIAHLFKIRNYTLYQMLFEVNDFLISRVIAESENISEFS